MLKGGHMIHENDLQGLGKAFENDEGATEQVGTDLGSQMMLNM